METAVRDHSRRLDNIPLACPTDLAPLEPRTGALVCTSCGRAYPVEGNLVRFLAQRDAFYEDSYLNRTRFVPRSERIFDAWPLWLINSGWLWQIRRHVAAGARVLELGCAGGVAYFGKRYRMIGCDVSLGSLRLAATDYEACLQLDATSRIPLADGSVDAIVSSYFWEHMLPADKPGILRECHRVLKSGGQLVFLYDVETRNPLIRRYIARDEASYRRLFLEGDGHVGYESPAANIDHFRNAGFAVVADLGMEKTWFQSVSVYDKFARFGGRWAGFFRRLAFLGRKPFSYLYTAFLRCVDTTVCRWLPSDRARIAMTIARRT